MIVIVAPYIPAHSDGHANLGASRKLEAVVTVMGYIDPIVVLVNSAHSTRKPGGLKVERVNIAGVEITEITPPIRRQQAIGKALNLLNIPAVMEAVLSIGTPRIVWLYNGYAFESLFGLYVHRRLGCPVVLEFEDWHFSRSRGLNPKPFIDFLFWRKLATRLNHAFAVNATLARRLTDLGVKTDLLPGLVGDEIARLATLSPPFSVDDDTVVVGYFGGLTQEKGADRLITLVRKLPGNYRFIVTGVGPLESLMYDLANQYPSQFMFHGKVDDPTLNRLIAECDVLINPHSPIDAMCDGVFPFKVLEYVASGRLVISTALPSSQLETVLAGVYFVDNHVNSLVNAVCDAPAFYSRMRLTIALAAAETHRLFSAGALQLKVRRLVNLETTL